MTDFIVARRLLSSDDEDDVIHITLEPVGLVKDAPEDVTAQEMKDVLQNSGEDGSNGVREEKWDWNNFAVVPDNKWETRTWKTDPREWADSNYEEALADTDLNKGGYYVFTYESLVERIYGKVRVSLLLPRGLHSMLKTKSDGLSFNSYCLSILAREAGETEMAEKFEAERRKPGRPKKLEIV